MAMKIDREVLAGRIRELEGLSMEERSALLELLNTKKYGLVWENHEEAVEEHLREYLPVLKEDTSKALTDGGEDAPNHILIEGDNLEALTALTYTHEGRVDVIYIDPPYNTGNKDFVYNDSFVDSEDGYRHSKWLSFMEKRLRLAKKLLSDNGVIFISIDDNEQANLKLLCDEVFGTSNFINVISVKAKASAGASGGGEDKRLKKNIEYLLMYSKQRDMCDIVFPQTKSPLIELIEEKREAGTSWLYTNVMYNAGRKEFVCKTPAGNGEDINIYKVHDFKIKSINEIMNEESLTEEQTYNKYIYQVFTTENAQTSIRQRVKDAVGEDDCYYIAEYVPPSGRNKGKLIEVGFIGTTKRLISYLHFTCHIENNKVYKLNKIGTLWDDLSWSSVASEGGITFPAGKKPIALIERVISMHPSTCSVVLDFFGGSASTAHAVMDMNSIDGGRRTAIICTNNENLICENKSYPRIRNVINGYGNKQGLHNNNLRYYQIDHVERESSLTGKRKLMEASTELICIKHDIYNEVFTFGSLKLRPHIARYFEDMGQKVLIIYKEEAIEYFVKEIAQMPEDTQIMVYVFSTNNYALDADFEEVADKVALCALPAAIYNAYLKVLPKKKVAVEAANEKEEELSLFDGEEDEQ